MTTLTQFGREYALPDFGTRQLDDTFYRWLADAKVSTYLGLLEPCDIGIDMFYDNNNLFVSRYSFMHNFLMSLVEYDGDCNDIHNTLWTRAGGLP